jgi:hypothetical protein
LIGFIIIFICWRGNLLAWWLERLLAGWERALRRVGPSLKISLVFDGSKKKERKWKATAAELRDKLPTK